MFIYRLFGVEYIFDYSCRCSYTDCLVKVKITLRELRWMTLKRLSPPTQKAASENDSSFVLILKEQVIVRHNVSEEFHFKHICIVFLNNLWLHGQSFLCWRSISDSTYFSVLELLPMICLFTLACSGSSMSYVLCTPFFCYGVTPLDLPVYFSL